jgi:hypothetical protein
MNAPYKISDRIHRFNQCAWCVPQKLIAGAVEVTLGNSPYKIGDRTTRSAISLRSAFGIALDAVRCNTVVILLLDHQLLWFELRKSS